ncbi:SUMF1/EgtB/PvdO family nonheme iron enzyme [Thiocapsa marina]|uniref:Sulphatase-modifying factor protein n=1 Tax=Thiocapsa marina 5811 TaxID=768671 RepID=F9UHP8_9GAMM|nr:SUMF1/EgtB/PvdO family nonheme iron enzyme [Thiocapsa marina]EGV16224.1 Sulphatase-modifying factor protein [Thiocapsa marina 5811]
MPETDPITSTESAEDRTSDPAPTSETERPSDRASPRRSKPLVVVSYAREDENLKTQIDLYLQSEVNMGRFDYWSDRSIDAGRNYQHEIERHLREADIAILLVSPYFFASSFVTRHELPMLCRRAEDGSCVLIPVQARPMDRESTGCLYDGRIQYFSPNGVIQWGARPTWAYADLNEQQRPYFLKDLVKTVRETLERRRIADRHISSDDERRQEHSNSPERPSREGAGRSEPSGDDGRPGPSGMPPGGSGPDGVLSAPSPQSNTRPRHRPSPYWLLLVLVPIAALSCLWLPWCCWILNRSTLEVLVSDQPVESASVRLYRDGRVSRAFTIESGSESRVTIPTRELDGVTAVAIDIAAPIDYLPLAVPGFADSGCRHRVDLDAKTLVPMPPMVGIPAGVLNKGIQDDSFPMQLIREYQDLNTRFGPDIQFDEGSIAALLMRPPRTVTLPDFYIDAYEVTNADYSAFLKSGSTVKHPQDPAPSDRDPAWSEGDAMLKQSLGQPDQPVSSVDFFDAYAYCDWADRRLPTEDEWEAAARGSDSLLYPWGDSFDEAFFNRNNGARNGPQAVSTLERPREGAPFGMEGNLAEWTSTDVPGGRKAMKGAGWVASAIEGRTSALTYVRHAMPPSSPMLDVGFRCASDKPPAKQGRPMIKVPAGAYRLGGPESIVLAFLGRLRDDFGIDVSAGIMQAATPGSVGLSAYRIDQHEVTNRQYGAFLDYLKATETMEFAHPEQPVEHDHEPKLWGDHRHNASDQPVVGVDWYNAYAFLGWIGKRLPTANEWERAARSSDHRWYPWGDRFDPSWTVVRESRATQAASVGSAERDRSPFDVLDLAGNVQEWTSTEGENSSKESRTLVLKGGSWAEPGILNALIPYRGPIASPTYRGSEVGFRGAADASAPDL